MEPDSPKDRYWPLWVLVHRTSYAMRRAREIELNKIGISDIQAAVLFTVKEAQNPLTPAEIARRLFREPHTVSALLSRMEKQGLLKKTTDARRKNQRRIEITPKGERVYKKATDMKVIHKIIGSLSKKKQEKLWDYLEILLSKSHAEMMLKHESPLLIENPWLR